MYKHAVPFDPPQPADPPRFSIVFRAISDHPKGEQAGEHLALVDAEAAARVQPGGDLWNEYTPLLRRAPSVRALSARVEASVHTHAAHASARAHAATRYSCVHVASRRVSLHYATCRGCVHVATRCVSLHDATRCAGVHVATCRVHLQDATCARCNTLQLCARCITPCQRALCNMQAWAMLLAA